MSFFHAQPEVSIIFLLIFDKVFEFGMEIAKTLFKVFFLAKENTREMSMVKSKTLIYFFTIFFHLFQYILLFLINLMDVLMN